MRIVGWLTLALLGLASCEGCEEAHVAQLARHEGDVERDFEARVAQWEGASDGATFDFGDGIRTLEDGSARLTLVGGGHIDLEAQTLVRFRRSVGVGAAPATVEVESGEATIETDVALDVRTELGPARLEAGARARVRGGARLDVLVGRATLERAGQTLVAGAGESLDLELGRAVIEDAVRTEPAEAETLEGEAVEGEAADGERATNEDAVRLIAEGNDTRFRASPDSAWAPLADGPSDATIGTELSLGEGARVTVQRGGRSVQLSGRGEHALGAAPGPVVRSRSGTADVIATAQEVAIAVPGGVIVATVQPGGTRARVVIGAEGSRLSVEQGEVRVVQGERERRVVGGDALTLSTATSDRPEGAALPAPGPERADVVASSGTIHAPRVPVIVAIASPSCPGEAIVEAGRRANRGTGHVHVSLPRGAHAYTVRCVDAEGSAGPVVARDRLRVIRDAGRAPVSRRPPTSIVDVDGRPYTVLYQNRLPTFVVRAPDVSGPGPYSLEYRTAGGRTRSARNARPRFELRSGSMGEGTHTLRVSSAGGQRSPATRVTVRFDNAAPTASLREPSDRGFAPGDTVRLAGATLAGWSVHVDGALIELDGQHRFDHQVRAPAGRGALAVRMSHPRHGVHYYLRFAR